MIQTPPPAFDALQRELVESLARLFRLAAPGAIDAVAAATGVTAGEGLPADAERLFRERPAGTLLAFDADRIQRWVFASERIQVVKGASKALADLNQLVAENPRGLPGVFGVAYSAGGSGMLFARPTQDDQERAKLEGEVREALARAAPGLTFTVVGEPLLAQDFARGRSPREITAARDSAAGRLQCRDGVAGALARLQVKVRERKDRQPHRPPMEKLAAVAGRPAQRCPSCGRRPPGRPGREGGTGDGPELWCGWCQDMRRRCPGRAQAPNGRPLSFNDLAQAISGRGRGALGFLALDGNGMGNLFQQLSSFLELRVASEAIGWVYERARKAAGRVVERFPLVDEWKDQAEEASLSLLTGGDEIDLVLPAAAGPAAALAACEQIYHGFAQITADGNLAHRALWERPEILQRLRRAGAGGGLVVAPDHYPVRLLRKYGNELQKEAKKACAARDCDAWSSALAWIRLTDSSPLPEGAGKAAWVHPPESFQKLLDEAQQAQVEGLSGALLHGLAGRFAAEARELSGLSCQERKELLPLLHANFFRYQLARHEPLRAWWQAVTSRPDELTPPATAAAGDPLLQWLMDRGMQRFEQLVELLALHPFPGIRSSEEAA